MQKQAGRHECDKQRKTTQIGTADARCVTASGTQNPEEQQDSRGKDIGVEVEHGYVGVTDMSEPRDEVGLRHHSRSEI